MAEAALQRRHEMRKALCVVSKLEEPKDYESFRSGFLASAQQLSEGGAGAPAGDTFRDEIDAKLADESHVLNFNQSGTMAMALFNSSLAQKLAG